MSPQSSDSILRVMVGGASGWRLPRTGQPEAAADLLYHLEFGLAAVTATAFFMLGAAAITFTTSFLGFFSSRRRLVKPLAMIWFLANTASS